MFRKCQHDHCHLFVNSERTQSASNLTSKVHRTVNANDMMPSMPNRELLHLDDFIEMLLRGDDISTIANYAHVKPESIEKRFHRLPKEVRDQIRSKREQVWGIGVRA